MKRFMAILTTATLASLFYVYAEVQAVQIGYEIRKLEEAKVQALDRGRALKYNIARLKAPNVLERKLLAQRIKLESPKAWQTLVLPGAGGQKPSVDVTMPRPPFFSKFFVGTAQAEAKETR